MANQAIAALAFVGDAVYELYIREYVAEGGCARGDELHREAVRFVRAESQAAALKYLMREGMLTDEETALVKRARNHKTPNRSRSADPVEYKLATAFEALLGMLYMNGSADRAREIMGEAREFISRDSYPAISGKDHPTISGQGRPAISGQGHPAISGQKEQRNEQSRQDL